MTKDKFYKEAKERLDPLIEYMDSLDVYNVLSSLAYEYEQKIQNDKALIKYG
jgi:hypothetical protein